MRKFKPRGETLIHCLIYISILAVVGTLSYKGLYRVLENSKFLRQNADQIVACLRAGEQWREDIRGARKISSHSLQAADHGFNIEAESGVIVYQQNEKNQLLRLHSSKPAPQVLLNGVKRLEWIHDPRQNISAWRLEVELMSKRENPRVRPVFSFVAVQNTNAIAGTMQTK